MWYARVHTKFSIVLKTLSIVYFSQGAVHAERHDADQAVPNAKRLSTPDQYQGFDEGEIAAASFTMRSEFSQLSRHPASKTSQ